MASGSQRAQHPPIAISIPFEVKSPIELQRRTGWRSDVAQALRRANRHQNLSGAMIAEPTAWAGML
jgi:hypothetical protein